jgi:hypothetical protein
VRAVAVGALPDSTPVIVSGGGPVIVSGGDPDMLSSGPFDDTVGVWRLADGSPVVPPLDLADWVRGVVVPGNTIVTVHQPVPR